MQRWLLVALLFAPASIAHADAIGMPPEDCPRGSFAQVSHSGEWCVPTTCTTDADCSPYTYTPRGDVTLHCQPLGLCVASETYVEGGMMPEGATPPTLTREVTRTTCTTDADCAAPARCIVAPRCVQPPHLVTGMIARACGCRASAPTSGAGALAMALGLAATVAARRIRRAVGAGRSGRGS